jgi:hypothetical protein
MEAALLPIQWAGVTVNVGLFDKPDFLDFDQFFSEVYQAHGGLLDTIDLAVVRLPVDQQWPAPTDSLPREEAFTRMPRVGIYLLSTNNYEHRLSANIAPGSERIALSETDRGILVASLREVELRRLAHETGAIFPADENLWYKTPSGAFTRLFIRVGNIQTRKSYLNCFFFWMLPHLRNCAALIADTWSISSIALNASRLLLRYDSSVARCPVDMVSQYDTTFVRADFSAILRRLLPTAGKHILVMISAQMTGRFERLVREIIDEYAHENRNFRLLTLYRLSRESEAPELCNLSGGFGGFNFDHHEELPETELNKTIIHIDKQSYFPLRIQETQIEVRRPITRQARPFFDRFAGKQVISVHRDVNESGVAQQKHRGIFVDVLKMLDVAEFRHEFLNRVRALGPPPKLILTPPHSAGEALAQLAKGALLERGLEARTLSHPNLRLDPENLAIDREILEAIRSLGDGDTILLLDDTCHSGTRIWRYAQNLRSLFSGRFHYLVGVARPADWTTWIRMARFIPQRFGGEPHSFDYIEKLILPDFDDKTCPWCRELNWLEDNAARWPAQQGVAERVEMLHERRQADGLLDDLFFSAPNDLPMRLGPGSLFLSERCSQADVFAAVASALQYLRTEGPSIRLTPPRFPVATMLNSQEYLRDMFTDSVLRACFLRSAQQHELQHFEPARERLRGDFMKQIVLHSDADWWNLAPEIFWNIAIGKLPKLRFTEAEVQQLIARDHAGYAQLFGVL